MLRFIARRLLLAAMVLWLITVAVFVLFFVTPHDPARVIAGRLATPQTVAAVRHRLGLDRPVPNSTATSWTGCCTAISATRTTTPSR
jgi:peptide/nickel transport system permease protein